MGSVLDSYGKLMFYPTSEIETYKMIPMLAELNINRFIINQIKNELGEVLYNEINTRACDNYVDFKYSLYDYYIETNQLDKIKEYFTIKYTNDLEDANITILDGFAGEAKWLDTFKSLIPQVQNSNLYLIANELESNRFNSIENNKNIDECTNLAFEYLQLPKKSCSIILNNCPYGETNNIRNARYYLDMLLNKDYIYNNKDKINPRTGVMISVLRGDDIIDCADIFVKNFIINFETIYRVNKDEYSKYKQYVLYAQLRKEPLNESNTQDAFMIQEGVQMLRDIILIKQPTFNIGMYRYKNRLKVYPVKYNEIKNNFKFVQNKDNSISNSNNSTWKWIKELTELKDISQEKLTLPKTPKLGELSLIISSGYINSQMSLEDGTADHVVIGGVKNLTKQESATKKDKEGKNYIETTTTKYTRPYLNLLINNKGKIEIKELGGE